MAPVCVQARSRRVGGMRHGALCSVLRSVHERSHEHSHEGSHERSLAHGRAKSGLLLATAFSCQISNFQRYSPVSIVFAMVMTSGCSPTMPARSTFFTCENEGGASQAHYTDKPRRRNTDGGWG